jgi:hypothetical protein
MRTIGLILGCLIGLCILASLIAPTTPTKPLTKEETAQKQRDEANFQRAVLGAKQLRASMRNPDSFKLGQTLVMDDGAVCYDYRAQNGFGGMNVGHAVLAPDNKFKSDESAGFHALWHKECAKKTGEDQTWQVGYAAGFHGITGGD